MHALGHGCRETGHFKAMDCDLKEVRLNKISTVANPRFQLSVFKIYCSFITLLSSFYSISSHLFPSSSTSSLSSSSHICFHSFLLYPTLPPPLPPPHHMKLKNPPFPSPSPPPFSFLSFLNPSTSSLSSSLNFMGISTPTVK